MQILNSVIRMSSLIPFLATPYLLSAQSPIEARMDAQRLVTFTTPVLIRAGSSFQVPLNTRAGDNVVGSAFARGGAANDIRVIIVRNRNVLYDSGQREYVSVDVPLAEGGAVTVILDNSFSVISSKRVWYSFSAVARAPQAAESTPAWPELNPFATSLPEYVVSMPRRQNRRQQEQQITPVQQPEPPPPTIIPGEETSDEQKERRQQMASEVLQALMPTFRKFEARSNKEHPELAAKPTVPEEICQIAEANPAKYQDILAVPIAHQLLHTLRGESAAGDLWKEMGGLVALNGPEEQIIDAQTVRLVCDAGFDPSASILLMETFLKTYGGQGSVRHHPRLPARLESIRKIAESCSQ